MVCRRNKQQRALLLTHTQGGQQVEESLYWFSYSVGERAAFQSGCMVFIYHYELCSSPQFSPHHPLPCAAVIPAFSDATREDGRNHPGSNPSLAACWMQIGEAAFYEKTARALGLNPSSINPSANWLWESYFSSLVLCIFPYKMGMVLIMPS